MNATRLQVAAVTLLLAAGCSGGGDAKPEQKNRSSGPGTSAPASADPSSSSPLLLSEDLVDRMIAVAQEGSAIKEASASSGDSDTPAPKSLDEIGDRIDANPATHALLARHGFTGRSYLAAMKTVAGAGAAARLAGTKWASRMQSGNPVDPRNIAFYEQHPALFARLEEAGNPGSSPGQEEQITRELHQIDPDTFDDCVRIVPATMSLGTISLRGTVAAPPSSRVQLAATLAKYVTQYRAKQLKDDFTTISNEIRRHAYEKQMHSPAYDAALVDVTQWAETHCKGEK